MRMARTAALTMLTVALLVTGCSRQISGAAELDADQQPLVEITEDENGIRAGLDDAPVQLEIYMEPQCSHCADLQADFGDQLAYYIGIGELAVTYRPLTFLDNGNTNGHSARVAKAMFEAATPGGVPEAAVFTTGRQFQRYVQTLWANQERGGPGPSDEELAEFARESGVPDFQVHEIETGDDGKTAAELREMEDVNFEFLFEIDPIGTGTPTVYDVNGDEKLDVYDNDWLSKLMES